jgi:hypothetical protein
MAWIIRTCEDCRDDVAAVEVESGLETSKLPLKFPRTLCLPCWRVVQNMTKESQRKVREAEAADKKLREEKTARKRR